MEEAVPGSGDGPGSGPGAWSAELIEEMYVRWKADPSAVSESWQLFLEGFEVGRCKVPCVPAVEARAQAQVVALIYRFRRQGHLIAQIDPLGGSPTNHPDLNIREFGFTADDLHTEFNTGTLVGPSRASLEEVLQILTETYCRSVGVEYMHIQQPAVRHWLQERMEPIRNRPNYSRAKKLQVLQALIDAHMFETFLHRHYMGQKRFSLEGAESVIPALRSMLDLAPRLGVKEVVLGMAHRGRLNVLANLMGKSYSAIFSEFEDNQVGTVWGSGDVKYHKGATADYVTPDGETVHLSLTANPSHLEAVDPVVEGRVRAKQRQRGDTIARATVVPLIIHGDAAFAGQGIVAETLNLAHLDGYRTGGTVHVIINNQIGFTATPDEARSSTYATDVAKMIEAPIFHVNGDDPEAVVHVSELALRFRQKFARDVVVDLVCYRRHGHNEGDDPGFTQPLLYQRIRAVEPVARSYRNQLIESGDLSSSEEERLRSEFHARLEEAKATLAEAKYDDDATTAFRGVWSGLDQDYSDSPVDTAVSAEDLELVARGLSTVPDGFEINPKIARRFQQQLDRVKSGGVVDWGFGELLAFGTLLNEGVPVRLSGQDSARGTFSQRHAVWTDARHQERYVPANNIRPGQAHFCVYNSLLSEAAVLGFEYGYSLVEPRMLILWEAQFGDFANGAQVIIDQFIASSELKWNRASGLVMLLPHGYEGQGPEHSNAYLERYLAACGENNIQVCNLTTPAQHFHVLRRQMKRPFRKPLILMSPKSLLRHKRAVSPVTEFTSGRFHSVLGDTEVQGSVRRLLLCSGKIFYDLRRQREVDGIGDTAIVRVEELYPFPAKRLAEVAARHEAAEICWVQEEAENRGAWRFVLPRLQELFPGQTIEYAGRPASASPATGSARRHHVQQELIVRRAFGAAE